MTDFYCVVLDPQDTDILKYHIVWYLQFYDLMNYF